MPLRVAAAEVQQILEEDSTQPTASSSDFWIMCAALKQYVANEGGCYLPLEVSPSDDIAATVLPATWVATLSMQHIEV